MTKFKSGNLNNLWKGILDVTSSESCTIAVFDVKCFGI
jgi:hypothetical protein